MGWLTDYSYRKSLSLSRASGAVTYYQIKITVHRSSGSDSGADVYVGSNCLSNYNDIRFTTSDETTLLDYWIESSDSSSAIIWVEFDSIGTGATTFYMYYGYASASAVSSGANTFLVFDHFNDASLNTDIWTIESETGNITITEPSGSNLSIAGTTNKNGSFWEAYIKADTTFAQSISVRSRQKTTGTGTGYSAAFSLGINTSTYCHWGPNVWTLPAFNRLLYFVTSAGADSTLVETDVDGNYHIYDVRFDRSTGNALIYFDDTSYGTKANAALANQTLILRLNGYARISGDSVTGLYDWIFVRKYEATEPEFGLWGAEETSSSPLLIFIPKIIIF